MTLLNHLNISFNTYTFFFKRYVYLSCGHWIEVEEMDKWIEVYREVDHETIRQIQCPSCPCCQQPIRQSFRYGDQIKEYYLDLTTVKFNFSVDRFASSDKIRPIVNKLQSNFLGADYDVYVEKINRQANSISTLNGGQRWDLLYRAQLTFLLSCIVDDAKKGYAVPIAGNKGKPEIHLDKSAVDLVLNKVSLLLRVINKHQIYEGYYVELFHAVKRYDLYRQYLTFVAFSKAFPDTIRTNQKELEQARAVLTAICWDEDNQNYLVDWLARKCTFYKVNLTGSVAKKLKLYKRLTMNGEHWFKCGRDSCEFIFSTYRFDQCPECLD